MTPPTSLDDLLMRTERDLATLDSVPMTPEQAALVDAIRQELPALRAVAGLSAADRDAALLGAFARCWPKTTPHIRALVRAQAAGEWWQRLLPPEVSR